MESGTTKRSHDYEEANDNCDVESNRKVQIKLKINVSHEDRYNDKNILRSDIADIKQYLMEGHKTAFEELYSTDYEKHIYDQHIRFFLDLDKVNNPRLPVIKKFISLFIDVLYRVFDEMPDNEVQISNQYTVDEIAEGARIAIKPSVDKTPGGVHIYFTNFITHANSFSNFRGVIQRVQNKGNFWYYNEKEQKPQSKLLLPLSLFKNIDLGLYNSFPNLRCIYALKDKEYECALHPCSQFPCRHVESKIYTPQECYDFSDYFFSYVGSECYDAMHIELLDHKENQQSTAEQSVTYAAENDIRNDTLSSLKHLINIIDNIDYSKYILVGLALFNKLQGSLEGKTLYKQWAHKNYKDKSQQIDHNWDTYWPSRTTEKKVGLSKLKKLAEESNPDAFKQWLALYSWSRVKTLVYNFTEVDVDEFVVHQKRDDYVYSINNNKWAIYNETTQLWDVFDDNCVIVDSVKKYVRSELNKLAKTPWAKRKLHPDDSKNESTNETMINSCISKFSKKTFIENVVSLMKADLRKDIEFDCKPDIVCYQDVVVDLKTGEARKRTKTDYCSKYNPDKYLSKYDVSKELIEVKEIHSQIFADTLDEELFWLGYCLTGSTTGYNIQFAYGPRASGGKNTVSDIFEICFPIYYQLLANNTFSKNNQKSHKQLIQIVPPIRLVTMHELKVDEMDTEAMKGFADGKVKVEIMYGTSTVVKTQCKLYATTNHIPKLQVDEGIKRRCLYNEVSNKFLPEHEYNELTDKTNCYIVRNIPELFNTSHKHRLAYFHLLLPYCQKFYKSNLQLPTLRNNFIDFCTEIDKWSILKNDYLEITTNRDDRMSRQDLADYYNEVFNVPERYYISADRAFTECRRIGLTYDKAAREYSRSNQTRGTGESRRGVFVYIRRIDRPNRNTPDPTI